MRPRVLLLVPLVAALVACGSSDPAGTCSLPDAGPGAQACSSVGTSEAPAPEIVKRLGQMTVGDSTTFDVPSGIASITVIEQVVAAPQTIRYQPAKGSSFTLDNSAVPLFVADPNGTKVYDDTVTPPADGSQLLAFFASNSPGTGTLTMPNTSQALARSRSGLTPGTWSLAVSDYAYECTFQQVSGACCTGGSTSSTYDVTVIMKPLANGALPTRGNLEVAIHFASKVAYPDMTAANAPTDPDFMRMQKTLQLLLGSAGLTVSVTYADLPDNVQTQYATGVNIDQTGSCSDLSQLFKQGDSGNKLNVFFVSRLNSNVSGTSSGNSVVGIDGTIPGPSTVGGTSASGVAVTPHDVRANRSACDASPGAFSLSCGADATAYFIAHETGHYLGLYHVTEFDGTAFDPLGDTPKCECQSCAPNPSTCANATPAPKAGSAYEMRVADCIPPTQKSSSCGGGDNLMFWILDTGSQGTLTQQQQSVMLANPLVQ